MRIAELSSPSGDSQTQLLLSQIESSINQVENLTQSDNLSAAAVESLVTDLRIRLTHLANLAPFPNSLQLRLWKLSYRLWNACVDLSNTSRNDDRLRALVTSLRHVAADLLFLAGQPPEVPSPTVKCASFYYKTGSVWHELRRFDAALACFEKATDLIANIDAGDDPGERRLFLDLYLARSRTAWELSDFNLAINLLARAKKFLFGCVDHYKTLASQYLLFGKCILAKHEGGGSESAKDSLKLMNEALELCDKGLTASRTRDEALDLKLLRSKALRFMAAYHLQFEEFDNVLKCIKVLRGEGVGSPGGDDHPSLSVMAVKAWLGLGRYAEAEKELKAMVANKGIPEGIWVSAVEAYFQAAGAAGAHTLKGVFLGLLDRCQVSVASAVRVVHRLIGDQSTTSLEGSDVRAKVVAELVSEERVVSLFEGDKAAKERTTLHSLLWNCAADHFRLKKYEISAEMFEKSMLYVPNDIENRSLRAKSYRVLCLCHLGLSQLDQAQEYIDVAEKLEPNIICAFLKFKILLQKKDYERAINQTKAMAACIDFTPDFLSLSAYEAVACHALSVAVASLSNLLDLYSSGNPMATPEVVVLRTIVTILSQSDGQEPEILKFIKHAHTRMSVLGAENFFGKGENGRRERSWFAATSWNIGRKTGKEENYELCAEFLMLASEFYGVILGEQEGEDNGMVCKSLILTVSAMLAAEKQRNCRLTTLDVKKAGEMLDRAGKMLPSLSSGSGTQLGEDIDTTVEANIIFMYTFSAYQIYGRLNDAASQQNIIKKFASSPVCSPDYLLQIGLSASQGPQTNYDVATFAFNKCLSSFLSSNSPDYQKIALVIRKLITVSSTYKGETDDDAVYNIYKQVNQVMVGLKEGEYPSEEGKWLAMTSWNRAALPVRLGQFDMARKWMKMGLELASKVSGMKTYQSCMEDFLAGFNRKLPNQEQWENGSQPRTSLLSVSVSSSPPIHTPTLRYFKPPNIIKSQIPPQPKTLIKITTSPTTYLLPLLTTSLPSLALAADDSPLPQQKINLEAIVVSIDDFFIKYPFFVTLLGVIWLVIIPLAQYYLNSYKYTSALDAFQKLRDDSNAALLDIRDDKSVAFLPTPDLSLFNKTAFQLHFSDDDDHMVFVNKVLQKFQDPGSTVLCVIDNFDGSSLKVAELLVKNGFKEAYAIKGGVRGKRGWQAIQEDVFPPSVHVYPKIKVKGSDQKETKENLGNGSLLLVNGSIKSDPGNGSVKNSSASQTKRGFRASSPYPNYPDLRPPSSPTPSKPKS
ncbi:unnamed protein product [Rhodiola kirilowii]